MTIGHIVKDFGGYEQSAQIMDSPGLLRRPDEVRNEMEALTLASLQHLPTAVMFVMDLSGMAGDACSAVEDQLALRRELRARFPKRPWIDVLAKYDLGVQAGARAELAEIVVDDSAVIELSVHEGLNVSQLKDEVDVVLRKMRKVLDVMEATRNSKAEEKMRERTSAM